MSSIDERIVNMKFNNRDFEKNVADTQKSLENLKKGLNLDGAKKGLSDLAAAGKSFTLSSIADGVETIASKFTALGVIGITALANITSRAVDAGLAMARSLTLDPIKAGFDEYELKMGSIQTILANTSKYGTTLGQVTASLDSLNTYADKTIYNFGDMTKNIGLFTNAGLRVEEATSIIKGFSNESAASGVSAQGAAGAAYQLSQALSTGTVRLMDFRSLTNVGLGNKNMQSGLIEIATAMDTFSGRGVTAADVTKDFNGSLEKGWLTAEVMSNYLKIMSGDMDEAGQAAIGLGAETIAAFAKQQKTAEEAATKVRTFTQLIGTLREAVGSSWAQTFDIMFGDFNEATELFTNVNNVLGGMVGAAGDARNNLLAGFKGLGGREIIIDAIANAFKALMNILTPIKAAFTDIFPPITAVNLLTIARNLQQFTAGLIVGGETMSKIKSTFAGVFAALDIGRMIIVGLIQMFGRLFGVAGPAAGGFLDITANIGDFIVKVRDAIANGEGLAKFFQILGNVLAVPIALLVTIGQALGDFISKLTGIDFGSVTTAVDGLGNKLSPIAQIGETVALVWEKAVERISGFVAFFAPFVDTIKGLVGQAATYIQEAITNVDFDTVLDLVNVGLLGGLILLFRKFFSGGINIDFGGGFLSSIKEAFGGVTDTLGAMQDKLKAGTLIRIAGAVAIITAAVVALSFVDSARLTSAMTAMSVMFVQLGVSMKAFSGIVAGPGIAKLPLLAAGMILVAVAINVLAGAVRKLSDMNWEELAIGLTGTTVLLAGMSGAAAILSRNSAGLITAGTGLVIFAAAIKILASAVIDLSTLSFEQLVTGLTGVAVGIGIMVGALTLLSGPGSTRLVVAAAAILLMATSIKILASAIQQMSGIAFPEMAQGLITLGIALGILIVGVQRMQTAPVGAAAMVVVAAAMLILAQAVKQFATLSMDEVVVGLTALAGSLAIIAIALNAMSGTLVGALAMTVAAFAITVLAGALKIVASMSWDDIGRTMVVLAGSLAILAGAMALMGIPIVLLGAVGLIAAAGAMMVLAPALILLGTMSWDEIGRGLTVLASALGILAVGGLALTVALPGLIGLGAAIVLIGVGTLAAGAGLLAMSIGLTGLAAAGALGAQALGLFLDTLIVRIPGFIAAVGAGIIQFAEIIATSGPALIAAFTTVILALAASVTTTAPAMTTAFVAIISSFLDAVNVIGPQLISTVTTLILALVNAIVILVPRFADAGYQIITGILNALASRIPGIVTAGTNVIIAFINGISQNLPRIIQAGINMIINFINGLANGIRDNQARMNAAGQNLASAIIDGMTSGLRNGVSTIINAAKTMANSALSAAKAALGIKSPSREFFKVGDFSGQGMANGLEAQSRNVGAAAAGVGNNAMMSLKRSMAGVSDLFATDMDMTPVIRPVLDLSAVKKEAGQLGGAFGKPTIDVNGAYARTSDISASRRQDAEAKAELANAKATEPTQVNYNQTLQSPKALSRTEVYRQTKNLLSATKGKVNDNA